MAARCVAIAIKSQGAKMNPSVKDTAKAVAELDNVDHRTLVGRIRRAKTRLKILEAAAHVFAKTGADGAVIDDFIRAAGISRGTFYNHFHTMSELLDATMDWMADDITRSTDPFISSIKDDATRLATAMRLYLRWAALDPKWCAFMAKIPHIGPFAERQVRRDIQAGARAGVFRIPDYDAAHDLLLGTSYQVIRRIAANPDQAIPTDYSVRLVLRGLGVTEKKIGEIMSKPLPPFLPPEMSTKLFR